jgi:single-stranded DNA-binding protein
MSKEQQPVDIMPLMRSTLPVSPVDDIAEGSGMHVRVGDGNAQVFPGSRVVRAELAGSRTRLTNLTRVDVEDGVFNAYGETEEHHSALRLDAAGLIFATSQKRQRTAEAGQGDVPAGDHSSELLAQTTVAIEAPAQAETSEQDDQERVNLLGRIGHAPQYRTTPKGTLVASFSLGVHPEPGQTDWHRIVLFGDRAEKLREKGLGKGDEVQVVGYPHERERTNQQTGETKTVTEIYAAVVKKPKERDTPAAPVSGDQTTETPPPTVEQ